MLLYLTAKFLSPITFHFKPQFKIKTNVWYDFILTALPEIFMSLNVLLLLIVISVSYFSFNSVNVFKHKFFAINLIKLSIKCLYFVLFLLIWHLISQSYFLTNQYINIDIYSSIFKILIIITSIFILQNSINYMIFHIKASFEYAFLVYFTTLFLVLLVAASSMILMFICILGFSLGLYILIMFDTPFKKSLEATIKYFYLSALSSGLIASGLFFTYLWLGGLEFWYIKATIYDMIKIENYTLIIIALYSIIFGFLFKLGSFPCHLWTPEIYAGAPNPIMGFFVLPVKIATLGIFLKFLTVYFVDAINFWNYLLWFSAIFSMIWGCLGAYTEDSFKKFIAYSSINQMGFLLIGIVCATFDSARTTIIYLLIYVIMNFSFLQVYLNTFNLFTKSSIESITDLKYYASNNWKFSIGLIIVLFSMAGIPPLAGFFGKYFLFLTAFNSEYYAIVFVGMATSLISTFYYLRFIKIMWFEESFVKLININSLSLLTTLNYGGLVIYFISILSLILFIFLNKYFFIITTLMVLI